MDLLKLVCMEFAGIKNYPLLELGLSQIYLNENKIMEIEKWFNSDDMSACSPIKVHNFGNGKYTIIDGHSRAYVAYKNGVMQVPIVYDNDELVTGEVGKKLYCADLMWCERFGIENISHLENRIIWKKEYQKRWIGRCDRSYDLLLQTTENERRILQKNAPKLFLYGAEEDLSELYFEDSFGKLYVYRNGQLSEEK